MVKSSLVGESYITSTASEHNYTGIHMLLHRSTILATVSIFACTPAVLGQSIRIECVTLSAGASSSGSIINLGQPMIGISSGHIGPITLDIGVVPCLVACPADFNADSVIDLFDYLDFVNAFSASTPDSDFNSDGIIDFFDYLDFVQAFAQGC